MAGKEPGQGAREQQTLLAAAGRTAGGGKGGSKRLKIDKSLVKFIDMPVAPLQTIDNAARLTGMSRCFIRKGCRDGSIPCVMSGNRYMVHLPRFLELLDRMSKEGSNA